MPFNVKKFWLYVRVAGLALVILFAAQLLFWNLLEGGQARLLPWMSGNNLTALAAAFALGLLAVRICKASIKAWRDLKVHLDERRKEEEGAQPAQGPVADKQWTPAQLRSPAGAQDKRSAADVWTGGEGEDGEKAQARPK